MDPSEQQNDAIAVNPQPTSLSARPSSPPWVIRTHADAEHNAQLLKVHFVIYDRQSQMHVCLCSCVVQWERERVRYI